MSSVLKASEEDRYLLLVAYSCNTLPARGADHKLDVASPRALEKACWRFADNGFKVGLFHEPGHEGEARIVENFIHRGKPMVFKAADGTEQVVRRGDWCIGVILSPKAWEMYKQGLIKGASPQGKAGRRPPRRKTLARIGRNLNV